MRWVILCLSVLFVAQPVSAALKKCKDDVGKIYYYNKILPSECQGKSTVEMNKLGVVMKRNEVVQRAPEPVIDIAKREEMERQRKEQQRLDNVLLNTYTGVDEIELAKTRNIEPVELAIIGIKKRLKIAHSQFNALKKQAINAKKSKSPMLARIKKDMIPVQRDVNNLKKELIAHKKKIGSLQAKYDADKKRFVQLKRD